MIFLVVLLSDAISYEKDLVIGLSRLTLSALPHGDSYRHRLKYDLKPESSLSRHCCHNYMIGYLENKIKVR